MRTDVLLLSGGTGAGHVMAAHAVEDELRAAGPSVTHLDAYQFLSPASRWAYTRAHLGLTEFSPRIYGPLYRSVNQSRTLAAAYRKLSAWSRRAFARTLQQLQPNVIVATHALGCTLAAPLKNRFGFRLALLTTDYYAHAFQYHPQVDAYCASHAWAAADLRAAGVSPDRVIVTGIPLRRAFDALPERTDARRRLGLPVDRPLVLITRGGVSAGRETVALLHAILAARALDRAVVVALLGSQERGHRLVAQRFATTPRLRFFPFVDTMDLYLAAADLVIGKAGGISSTETFSVGRPLVIYAHNAGLETPNVQRFAAAGAALDAGRSPERVVRSVQKFLQHPGYGEALTTAGRALVTPRSRRIVRGVLERLLAERGLVRGSR